MYMRRPRHLGRWIGGGAALAAFVAVATAISSAGAGTVPSRAKPHHPPKNLGIVHGTNAPGVIPNSYIVGLKNASVSAAAVNATATTLATKYGGTVSRTYSHALRGFAAKMTASQAKALAANPEVAFVEQNRTLHVLGTESNPPSWGIDRIDQSALPTDDSYTFPNTASNVHAYVIDTGIHVTHEQFGGRAAFGENFTGDGINDDCMWHGTHVAGTIGGSTTGVARQVHLQ